MGIETMTATGIRPALNRLMHIPADTFEIDPLSDPRWETFVDNHPLASVFHTTSWLRALRAVHGYDPVVMTTCRPGECLTNGLVYCRVKSWITGRRLVSVPFADHCEPLVNNQCELDTLLIQLKNEVQSAEWKYVEIRPITSKPGIETDLSRFNTYHLHRLDLRLSEAQLFQNLHKDCIQRKVRRAEREKLLYEEGTSEVLLQQFYRLLVGTRRRQSLPPQPLSWFRGLIAAFGGGLTIRLASKNGVPVASILTLSHRKAMVYKYGCSDAAFNNLGGTPLLFWRTMQDAKRRGLEQFDLGRSDIDNLGLIAFKQHLGAAGRLVEYWTYPQGTAGLPSIWKNPLTQRAISLAPNLALKFVGTHMYRHIG